MGMNTMFQREHWLVRLPSYIGLVVATVGCAVLLGWAAHIPILTSFLPGMDTMKPNAAAAFIMAAVCLWLLGIRADQMPSAMRRRAADTLAMGMAAIGLLTLAEYATGVDLGIDRILLEYLVTDAPQDTSWRMAPVTAINVVLLGAGFLSLDRVNAGRRRPAH